MPEILGIALLVIPLQRLAYATGIDRDVHAGALLLQEHGRARIALAPAAVERRGQLVQGEVCHGHRHVQLAAEGGGECYVLVRQAQGKVRRVVDPGKEVVDQPVEGARPPQCALPHRLPQGQRLHPGFDAHGERFRQRAVEHVAHTVMDELGDAGGADRAHVPCLVADGVERRLMPVAAPRGPPLTGASSMWARRAANAAWMRRTTAGELVDRSKYAPSGRIPARRPLSLNVTSSTSAGPGSEVNTTSAASATCRGVSAQAAPAARCGVAASRRASCTTRRYP